MQLNINEELRAPKEESRRHLKCITLSIRAEINLVRSLLLIDGAHLCLGEYKFLFNHDDGFHLDWPADNLYDGSKHIPSYPKLYI